MKKDPSLVPTRWKRNLELMRRRDLENVRVPFRRWTQREIQSTYTQEYVDILFAKANQGGLDARA